jgi:hypothetical protein
MKYRATATISLLVVTVFEDDNIHDLNEQAIEALDVEAQCCYCLRPGEFKLNSMEVREVVERQKLAHPQPVCTEKLDHGWSR